MRDTNRSLWLAILACVAMAFYAKSPQYVGDKSWVTLILFVATLAIAGWGFWLGLRGARRQRTFWSWLAPGINAFLILSFLAFFALILRALYRFQ